MSTPPKPRPFSSISVGDELTPMVIDVTATVIAAGAIATRDFMPVHHDRDYANAQGAPDIFMNILSSNAYCSRFLTDWAGPDAMVRKLSIRLGVSVHPGLDAHLHRHRDRHPGRGRRRRRRRGVHRHQRPRRSRDRDRQPDPAGRLSQTRTPRGTDTYSSGSTTAVRSRKSVIENGHWVTTRPPGVR